MATLLNSFSCFGRSVPLRPGAVVCRAAVPWRDSWRETTATMTSNIARRLNNASVFFGLGRMKWSLTNCQAVHFAFWSSAIITGVAGSLQVARNHVINLLGKRSRLRCCRCDNTERCEKSRRRRPRSAITVVDDPLFVTSSGWTSRSLSIFLEN